MDIVGNGNAHPGTSGTTRHALGHAGRRGARRLWCLQSCRITPGDGDGGDYRGCRGHHDANRCRVRGGRRHPSRRPRIRARRAVRRRESLRAAGHRGSRVGVRDRSHGRRWRDRVSAGIDRDRDRDHARAGRTARSHDRVLVDSVDRSAVRRRGVHRQRARRGRGHVAVLRQRHQRHDALTHGSHPVCDSSVT